MQITHDEDRGVLKITGTVGIDVVEQLHPLLRDLVIGAARPAVDLSQIDTCDTAVLQLLYSARQTAQQAGKPFEFLLPSAAVLDTSAALGLSLTDEARDAI